MKRTVPFLLALFALTANFLGCSESRRPLEPEGVSVLTVLASAGIDNGCMCNVSVSLVAGRTADVGMVCCAIKHDTLYVTYSTDGGWVLSETHLAVAASLEGLPLNPPGNPVVGHFPFKSKHDPPADTHRFAVDLDALGLVEAEELVIAAHADVLALSDGGAVIEQEGAWGDGYRFPRSWTPGHPKPRKLQKFPSRGGEDEPEPPDITEPGGGPWAMYFTAGAYDLRGLLLWNGLGSDLEVQNSEIGPGGVITGDLEYLPCKFGLGFKPLPRTGDHNIPDNFVDYPGLNLGNKGCIEFWYHADWTDWRVGHCIDLLCFGLPEGPPVYPMYHIALGFNDWQNRIGISFVGPFIGPEYAYLYAKSTYMQNVPQWTTAEPMHMAVTWDGTNPDMSQRANLYINGIYVVPSYFSCTGDPTFGDWPHDSVLRMGTRLWSGDWDRHHWEGDHGIFDDVQVWSCVKTDF